MLLQNLFIISFHFGADSHKLEILSLYKIIFLVDCAGLFNRKWIG